jgi:hypothetical protein
MASKQIASFWGLLQRNLPRLRQQMQRVDLSEMEPNLNEGCSIRTKGSHRARVLAMKNAPTLGYAVAHGQNAAFPGRSNASAIQPDVRPVFQGHVANLPHYLMSVLI